MKLVKHSGNIRWKVHKQAWNLHEIEFTFMCVIIGFFFLNYDFLIL